MWPIAALQEISAVGGPEPFLFIICDRAIGGRGAQTPSKYIGPI
jgi:hypothetical protein